MITQTFVFTLIPFHDFTSVDILQDLLFFEPDHLPPSLSEVSPLISIQPRILIYPRDPRHRLRTFGS